MKTNWDSEYYNRTKTRATLYIQQMLFPFTFLQEYESGTKQNKTIAKNE